MANEVSERCGLEISVSRILFGIEFIDIGSHCCSRTTWREYDRCVWHADAIDKPIDLLEKQLEKEYGFIVSPILRGLSGKGFSAENSLFINADFSDSSLISADFSNLFIISSTFKRCDLRYSSLRRTRLHLSEFFDVDLKESDLFKSEFYRCYHYNTDVRRADITSATLGTAKFYNCYLDNIIEYDVDFAAALLKNCSLQDCFLVDSNFQYLSVEETKFTRTTLGNCDFTMESVLKTAPFGRRISENQISLAQYSRILMQGEHGLPKLT